MFFNKVPNFFPGYTRGWEKCGHACFRVAHFQETDLLVNNQSCPQPDHAFGRSEYVCHGEKTNKKDTMSFSYLSFCTSEMMLLFYSMAFFGLKCIH